MKRIFSSLERRLFSAFDHTNSRFSGSYSWAVGQLVAFEDVFAVDGSIWLLRCTWALNGGFVSARVKWFLFRIPSKALRMRESPKFIPVLPSPWTLMFIVAVFATSS